jgi:hypothetical protein
MAIEVMAQRVFDQRLQQQGGQSPRWTMSSSPSMWKCSQSP